MQACTLAEVDFYSDVYDVILNIYVGGTANPAIIATRDAVGDWTIERHDPSDGTLIDSYSGGSSDATGVVTMDDLILTAGTLWETELVIGENALTHFAYGVTEAEAV
jgi:hypothetical protein